MTFLVIAYALIWAALFFYIWFLGQQQKSMQNQLRALQEQLEEKNPQPEETS